MLTGEIVTNKIKNCHNCPLAVVSTPVPGTLNPDAKFVVIGEAPGAEEDAAGKPFIGPSGRLLRSIFSRYRIDLDDYGVMNTISCRPPDNRTPFTGEIHACKVNRALQLSYTGPQFVLLLGATALGAFHTKLGVTKHHGIPFHLPKNKISYGNEAFFPDRAPIFFPTFHPAAALRYPPNKKTLEADIDNFVALINADNPYELFPQTCIRCETEIGSFDPVDFLVYCDRHYPTHRPYDAPLVPTKPPEQGVLV